MTHDPLDRCLDALPVAVLRVDREGVIRAANAAAVSLLGFGRQEIAGQPVENLVPESRRGAHRRDRQAYLSDPVQRVMGGGQRTQAVRRDGALVPVRVTLAPLDAADGAGQILVTLEDLSALQRLEDALRVREQQLELARRQIGQFGASDPVTGARNRAAFFDDLRRHVALSLRSGRALSVLVLDLDGFTAFNAAHGQGAGDALLKQAAAELRAAARQSDLVSRVAADTFTVILPDTDAAGSLECAERIRRALSGVEFVHGPVSVSIGVATLDPAHEAVPRSEAAEAISCRLYGNAAAAMREARRRGGGQVLSAEALSPDTLRGAANPE